MTGVQTCALPILSKGKKKVNAKKKNDLDVEVIREKKKVKSKKNKKIIVDNEEN